MTDALLDIQAARCARQRTFGGSTYTCELPAGHYGPHEQGQASWLSIANTELTAIQCARRILLDVILDGNIPEGDEYDDVHNTIQSARLYLQNREAELRGETLYELQRRELQESLAKLKGVCEFLQGMKTKVQQLGFLATLAKLMKPCLDCGEPSDAAVCPRCIEERRLAR